MNGLDQLQPVEAMGPVGEVRLVPDLEHLPACFPTPRIRGAVLTDHVAPRRRAGGRLPALVPEADGGPARRARARAAGGVRERVLARHPGGRRYVPIDSGLCFSTIATTAAQDYADELVAALEAQEIAVEQYYAELGHGQQEISTGHAPALRAADEQLLVRETIRGVAARHGLVASLAPKPWPENAGNGGPRPLLAVGAASATASTTARRRRPLGGRALVHRRRARAPARALRARRTELQLVPPASCRSTGPAPSSAGATTTARRRCGSRRRSAASEEASTNAELKACDASCNPYLALGGLIAAGLDGLERGLEPPEPVDVDPATIAEDERDAARDRAACPATQARRSTHSPPTQLLTGALGPVLADVLPRRPPLRVGGLLRGRRGIRAAGPLREVLSAIPLVDHHAHGILRAPPATLDEFRGLFSESPDPRQWPHVATGVTYRRAIRVLAAHLGCEPTEEAVYARRLATDPAEYAASLLRATGTEVLLVDDGYPAAGRGTSWHELGELAGCAARPVLRIERVARGRRRVADDGRDARASEASSR